MQRVKSSDAGGRHGRFYTCLDPYPAQTYIAPVEKAVPYVLIWARTGRWRPADCGTGTALRTWHVDVIFRWRGSSPQNPRSSYPCRGVLSACAAPTTRFQAVTVRRPQRAEYVSRGKFPPVDMSPQRENDSKDEVVRC